MKLGEILEEIEISNEFNDFDIEIENISYDSRKILKNCLFVCLTGKVVDGHKFANDALKNGAKIIICEKDLRIRNQIMVNDSRKALSRISANFFKHPSKFLNVIAITGTKGKTTTACFISDVLNNAGQKTAQIGTLGITFGDCIVETKNTTPESFEIQKYMRKFVDLGFKNVVIEASSIGLKDHRIDDVDIDYGVFTNLSRDHIGENEHENLDEYIKAKSLLFKMCKIGIINLDDFRHDEITKGHKCKILTYGFKKNADIFCENFEICKNRMRSKFLVNGEEFWISIPGKYNIYNALASISVCGDMGIDCKIIKNSLKNCKVRGRSEVIFRNDLFTIIIDYAHNAVGMENVLKSLRSYHPKRLVTVFGAGGNRSKERRFPVGRISGEISDLSVITSDNSRYEDTYDIMNDIKRGILSVNGKFVEIADRREAIEYCIKNFQRGDVILIAGKGHETYQEINGVSYHFDEREVVNEILLEQGII